MTSPPAIPQLVNTVLQNIATHMQPRILLPLVFELYPACLRAGRLSAASLLKFLASVLALLEFVLACARNVDPSTNGASWLICGRAMCFLREHLLRDAEAGGDERADREEIEHFLAAMDVQQLRHSCMMLILQQQGELDDTGNGMAAQLDVLQDIVAGGDDFLDEDGDSDAEAGGAEEAA